MNIGSMFDSRLFSGANKFFGLERIMNTTFSQDRLNQIYKDSEIQWIDSWLDSQGLIAREADEKLANIFQRLQQIRLDSDTLELAQALADNRIDAGIKLLEKLEHALSLGFSNLDIYQCYQDTLDWLNNTRYRRDSIRPDDRIKNHSIQTPKTANQLPLDIQATWKRATGYVSPEQADLFSRLIQPDPDSDMPDAYHQDYERQFTPSLGLHKSIETSNEPYERPKSPTGDTRRVKFLPK